MKKIYINPSVEIIEISTQQMLATSLPSGGNTNQNLAPEFDIPASVFDI